MKLNLKLYHLIHQWFEIDERDILARHAVYADALMEIRRQHPLRTHHDCHTMWQNMISPLNLTTE